MASLLAIPVIIFVRSYQVMDTELTPWNRTQRNRSTNQPTKELRSSI
jgi:hypothetical protein